MPARKGATIQLRGVRQHNLKGFDLDLPIGRLNLITGLSGSGKSSLAFDCLYAEGQRRYVETFSAYARQFLERLPAPQVDSMGHVPAAIAIDASQPVKTSRSTVGTMTELQDYLKLLFAKAAILHCAGCDRVIEAEPPDRVARDLLARAPGQKVTLGFLLREWSDLQDDELLRRLLLSQGIRRIQRDGQTLALESCGELSGDDLALWSRESLDPDRRDSLLDSIEGCMKAGGGRVRALFDDGSHHDYSLGRHCAACDLDYVDPSPNLFSFNSPLGACPTCRGFGRTIGIDPRKVVPDESLSLRQGAIRPFRSGMARSCQLDLERFARKRNIDLDRPWAQLPRKHQRWIFEGHGEFYGVEGFFSWLESKTYKMHVRVLLSRYRSYDPCRDCGGSRLKAEALLYRLGGKTMADLDAMPITELRAFFEHWSPDASRVKALAPVLDEVRSRSRFLDRVGVGYLNMGRQSRTLSGGETKRVDLARALGSNLVNTMYVLDEPTTGLHGEDGRRLGELLAELRDRGNTLVVVEHDLDLIRQADFVVELGPGPGAEGGQLMHAGSLSGLKKMKDSPTGRALRRGPEQIRRQRRELGGKGAIGIRGARLHNLDGLDLDIPLGGLVAVCGVSGSGKTSLVRDVLVQGATGQAEPSACEEILGLDAVEQVVFVGQEAVPRTPSTNPVSYIKALAPIRECFANTEEARRAGYRAGDFSHRGGKGRCETCQGAGHEKVEMQFLSDVYVPCPDCHGLRFSEETLALRYRGLNMAQVYDLTVGEAMGVFGDKPAITARLKALEKVGLEYLKLGQPASTLSTGEAQRLKLAAALPARPGKGRRRKKGDLYVFDEPTVGLHSQDVAVLLRAFDSLLDAGHSVLVIEHHPGLLSACDQLIELGPKGGKEGGRLVAQGPPEDLAARPDSPTGRVLAGTGRGGRARKRGARSKVGERIRIQGARQHNLKALDLELPRDRLLAVTGVSGSGKSSLAFDLIFAEGQRRYLDSVSAYARQYISQMSRPEVDRISGLPPAVAVEQRISRGSARSNVASLSEIHPYFRLLFARCGQMHCPDCGVPSQSQTPAAILRRIKKLHGNRPTGLWAPVVRGRKGEHRELLDWAKQQGFEQVRVDGKVQALKGLGKLRRYREHWIELKLGRVKPASMAAKELRGLVQRGLDLGKGGLRSESRAGEEHHSLHGACPSCGLSFGELEPRSFSFNSAVGACPICDGLGRSGDDPATACGACGGSRLRPESLAVRFGSRNLAEWYGMDLRSLDKALARLRPGSSQAAMAGELLAEIRKRVGFCLRLGLDYLSLGRAGDSLSGGEAQRIRLAAQLGSNLRGVLYVVDEPTIGLHPRDAQAMIRVLQDLREQGNTVMMVEHDEACIQAADLVLELGPGPGEHGGRLVQAASPSSLKKKSNSPGAKALAGHYRPRLNAGRSRSKLGWVTLRGARWNNLRDVDLRLVRGEINCITGVSGSGKSSLAVGSLAPALRHSLGLSGGLAPGERYDSLEGMEGLGRLLLVDQMPIGRTSRSTVSTYLGVFDPIRKLFAGTPEARMRGWSASRFSFNVKGGRCENCKGQGRLKMEMSFLPDVHTPCPVCRGQRYRADTLSARFRGSNIAEVLDMSIGRAADFFQAIPEVAQVLAMASRVGLSYLKLGQTSPTLSGGEAQRIKLVSELGRTSRKECVYVLEEPSTGLHAADVARLQQALDELKAAGHTIVLVEHNLDLISAAGWVVDLGPEGGKRGGRIVASGPPKKIAQRPPKASRTAKFLAERLTP